MKNSQLLKKAMKKGFKIGYFDIENSPELSWNYGHWKVNIPFTSIEVPSQVTSIAWMDEKDKQIHLEEWKRPTTTEHIYNKHYKDCVLLTKVLPILNKFDLLIGQNLDEFDIKVLNGRAWQLKIPPLNSPFLTLDTLKSSHFVFRLSSHKLDSMTRMAGIGSKIKQDMDDCIQTAKGNDKISDRRLKYNKRDVRYGSRLFWNQLDYYKLPQKLIDLLKLYINTEDPTFCIRCASSHKSKFNVKKRRKAGGGWNMTCINCDYEWSIK